MTGPDRPRVPCWPGPGSSLPSADLVRPADGPVDFMFAFEPAAISGGDSLRAFARSAGFPLVVNVTVFPASEFDYVDNAGRAVHDDTWPKRIASGTGKGTHR